MFDAGVSENTGQIDVYVICYKHIYRCIRRRRDEKEKCPGSIGQKRARV